MKLHKSKQLNWQLLMLLAMASVIVVVAHAGGNLEITQSLVAAGGGTSSGQGFVLNSGIGQEVVGISAGGSYQLSTGFFRENRDLLFSSKFESFN